MKRMNKFGQFYLVASVIIVVVVVGMITISNYSFRESNSNVEKYGKEFKIESEKVLDYDALNSESSIENFSGQYSAYIGSKINASYIYGTTGNLEAYTFISGNKVDLSSDLSTSADKIYFDYDNASYTFDLEKGQNFYFVFSQDIGGEKYVYTN